MHAQVFNLRICNILEIEKLHSVSIQNLYISIRITFAKICIIFCKSCTINQLSFQTLNISIKYKYVFTRKTCIYVLHLLDYVKKKMQIRRDQLQKVTFSFFSKLLTKRVNTNSHDRHAHIRVTFTILCRKFSKYLQESATESKTLYLFKTYAQKIFNFFTNQVEKVTVMIRMRAMPAKSSSFRILEV